ncbi:hypothetical protein Sste5346_002851 [Sporothrix stenoceras]|uniref:Stress activated map kinase interacting n=1 Tax=Sporothrix stenoceras TaxID=5173 RepID=A0ABR3ZGE1_9PEZI
MGLVDYDSDGSGSSDGEAAVAAPPSKTTTTTTTAAGGKKPFQKLVDRSNPGKIMVNLPSAAATKAGDAQDGDDDRPAKRAKVGAGGSRFSGFGSFLPPPKKTGAAATAAASTTSASKAESPSTSSASPSSTTSTSRQGVNLKTSSEAAFSRRDNSGGDALPGSDNAATTSSSSSLSSRMGLPPPKAPSIPKDQKAAEEVKLVGNPLMFMPLSVSRKPGGKKQKKPVGSVPASTGSVKSAAAGGTSSQPSSSSATPPPAAPPPKKKKVSLFSLGADDQAEAEKASAAERAAEEAAAEAAVVAESAAADDYQSVDYSSTYQAPSASYGYGAQQGYYGEDPAAASSATADTTSLNAFADNMHLSAKERRELFGRTGAAAASVQIAATFNMDQEYRHNEQLRHAEESAAQNGGQQQSHNPVRTLMPGKHSLRQLVNQVHTQQDALEETFAKNRQSQREAGGKYGWR